MLTINKIKKNVTERDGMEKSTIKKVANTDTLVTTVYLRSKLIHFVNLLQRRRQRRRLYHIVYIYINDSYRPIAIIEKKRQLDESRQREKSLKTKAQANFSSHCIQSVTVWIYVNIYLGFCTITINPELRIQYAHIDFIISK